MQRVPGVKYHRCTEPLGITGAGGYVFLQCLEKVSQMDVKFKEEGSQRSSQLCSIVPKTNPCSYRPV